MRFILSLLMIVAGMASYAQIPSNGLVAWYPFNGNANDESGNGNNGVVNGATLTADRFGNANGAYSFNFNQNIVSSIINSSEYSISIWAKITSWNTEIGNTYGGTLVSHKNNELYGNGWAIEHNQQNWSWLEYNGNSNVQHYVGTPQLNQWYNVILVSHADGSRNFYINGTLIDNYTGSQIINGGNILEFKIGSHIDGPTNWWFRGILDDVGYWNRSLTTNEINQVSQDQTGQLQPYTTCLPAYVPTNGLVGYWPFCGNANDESGNGNDGVVYGATLTTDRNGNMNSAYEFNGINNHVRVEDNNSGSLDLIQDYSFSVWVNLTSHVYSPHIITKHLGNIDNMGTYTYLLQSQSANYPYYVLQQATPHYDQTTETTVPSDFQLNNWYHLSCTYNEALQTLTHYVNGIAVATISVDHNIQNTDIDVVFGACFIWNMNNLDYFFNGKLDDIAIYNRTLTPQEIQALYLSGQTPCSPVTNTISASIVQGQSYTLGTQNLTAAGTYTEVFTSAAGCDSTVTLTLNVTSGCLPAYVPTNGLVGYWPFCGNANDESGNGNNGEVNGAMLAADRFGNQNASYSFNGLNDYIFCGYHDQLSYTNTSVITLSFWFNSASVDGVNSDLFDLRSTNNSSTQIYLNGPESNNILLNNWNQTTNCGPGYLSAVNFAVGQWIHVVDVVDFNNNSMTLYVNGALTNTSQIEPCTALGRLTNPKLNLGSRFDSYNSRCCYFKGALDEIGFWNRALTPQEIQALYLSGQTPCSPVTNNISASIIEGESYTLGTQTLTTAGTYNEVFTSAAGCDSTVTLTLAVEPLLTCNITAPTTTLCAGESVNLLISATGGAGSSSQLPANLQQGLVAYYPFNGNANDESGNGFNGVTSGNMPYVSDRWGNSASAISFDAANCNSQVQATINDQLISGSLSISFWVNRQGSVCENPRYFASYFSQVGILNNTNGHFQIIENASGFSINHVVGDGVVSASDYESIENQWTLVSYVNDGIHGYFYKNGILFSEVNNSSNADITLGNLIILGHLGNSWASGVTAFLGHMDDVMIWGRALSSNEIQQLYTAQSYAWNTGATTNSITVSPTANTTYSCTVTQGAQTCTASIDITVNPTVINEISATIIEGESYILGTQTLTTSGTYTEVFTSAAGCDSIVTLNLSVIPLLSCEITSNSTSICSGEELTLNISSNVDDILAVGESTFNGQGYIQFPNTGLTGSTSRTITYKAKTTSQNIMSVLNYGGAAGNGTGLVELGMNLDMWFGAGSGYCDSITKGVSFFSNSHSVNIGKTVFDNQWHTITYVMGENNNFAFSSIKVYVDGILVSQGQNNTPFCGHNWGGWQYNTIDGPLTIGKPSAFNPYASKFVGSIADVAMWSRALSSSEVLSLNAQSPNIISNGLAHYYPLTGGTPLDVVTGATGQVLGLSTSNINWSTGATSASIIVNPTSNTSYSCTVNAGPQTCTASVDITVSPQQIFYADADGDGFGNPQVVVTNCNQPAGYVTDNTDCNDNDASVYVASTETCNGLDDNCDGQVDEGLTLGSVTATSVTTALYPTCSGNALKSANLNNGANSPIIDGNGLDLWYSMTAQYNTLRASLSAAFGDNEIRLYSYNNGCFELMETEHEVYTTTTLGTGNQVLISDDLLVGQTYYIAVHNITGPMNTSAKMCFNHFVGSTCDHYYSNNTGVYNNVCTSFKAQYKGNATNYIFDILSATQNSANLNITPWSYTTTTANSVVPRLGTIFPVNMSNAAKVYTLRIPVIYAIPDAAGNYTSITANATTICTVTLNAELPIALRAADRCPNTKTTTSSISVDRTICGAQRYEWEFTQQLPSVQAPVTVLGGLNTTVFFLNNVPGMGTGKTYNVRVRPIHANGEVGNWGTAQCLKTGTSGMVMQSESDNESGVWANNYSPEQAVTLYPNPTSTGHFTLITNSTEEVKQIAITDITGKIVFQSQVVMNGNSVEVEFGDLATGMYLVMVGEERLRLVVE